MKLFIIGNGFDIDHKMKTRFCQFRCYFKRKYCSSEAMYPILPEITHDKDGDLIPNKNNAAVILFRLFEQLQAGEKDYSKTTLWQNFEQYLGKLDYSDLFEIFEMVDDHETDYFHQCGELAENLKISVPLINEFFSEWVNQIKISAPKENFSKLFTEDSLFLTFNYTHTLEKSYHINKDNICHIHGEQNGRIIIGHGEEYDDYDRLIYAGMAPVHLSEIQENLRKKVELNYDENFEFFQKIKNSKITDIYSIGFSFSEVDLYYIKQLCNIINTDDIIWHFAKHDEKKIDDFKDKILKSGYNGKWGELI